MYHILFYTDMNDNRAVWQVKLCSLTIAELFTAVRIQAIQ